MPLVCQSLPRETLSKLNHEIHKLPLDNALHKECMDGDVTVFEKNGCAIYHSAAGFYFIRIIQSLEDTIYEDIRTPREYLCTAFEIQSGDESAKKRLLERFQETYGKKYSDMIEHECFNYQCKYILLAKFPTCVVRHLFAKSGGNMRTIISGPTESLKQIPTLVRLGNINKEDERSTSVFVTQYGPNMFPTVNQIHYDLIREVLSKPNIGVTVGPFMVWDP